jgi:hypothetical protein
LRNEKGIFGGDAEKAGEKKRSGGSGGGDRLRKELLLGGRDVGELSWRVMWLKSREFEFARGSAILMGDHRYCAQVTIGAD